MKNCYFCQEPLKMLSTVTLSDNTKICQECHAKIVEDLKLNFLNSRKITLDTIEERYNELNRNFSKEINIMLENRKQISDVGIFTQTSLQLQSGAEALKTSPTTIVYQLNDDRIFFDKKEPEFYYLLDRDFSGAKFKEEFTSSTKGDRITDSNTKTKKKGKTGRVATGALIGSLIMPGIGTAVGAYAGGKGKDKKNKKNNKTTTSKESVRETRREVEVPSLATLTLLRISDNKQFIISVSATTADYSRIQTLQLKPNASIDNKEKQTSSANMSRDEAIEKLKELKELADLGILTDEEFEGKRKEFIKLL